MGDDTVQCSVITGLATLLETKGGEIFTDKENNTVMRC